MIIKSLVIFILLMLGYNYYINNFQTPSAKQNQNQENLIKAQSYLFELQKQPKNVIVGTSLSCHIIVDSLDNYYNLAFNGSSIFDGLQIILKSRLQPSTVFIETNYFLKQKSDLLSSELNSTFPYFKAKHFKIFRWNEQPVGKLITVFDNLGYEIVQNHNLFMSKVRGKFFETNKKSFTKAESVFNFNLSNHMKFYNKIPTKKESQDPLDELIEKVGVLQKRNIEVIFFEMPVHYSLENTPYLKWVRKNIAHTFFNKCKYYAIDSNYHYETTDGIHLNQNDSHLYTKHFEMINKSYR